MTLHILTDLEQRSDEWYAARRGIVTASAVGKLITVRKLGALDFDCPACGTIEGKPCLSKRGTEPAPIKTLHPERTPPAAQKVTVVEVASNEESRGLTALLVAERIAGFTDPTWVSMDMNRGIFSEAFARDAYAKHFGVEVREVGFMTEDQWGFSIGLSPDGLVGDDGLIEIKSPRNKGHVLSVVADQVPFEHVAQIQCALLVSGRAWCDFISYAGGLHLYRKRVYPDPTWQKVIVDAVRAFEANAAEMAALYMETVDGLPITERIDFDSLGLVF